MTTYPLKTLKESSLKLTNTTSTGGRIQPMSFLKCIKSAFKVASSEKSEHGQKNEGNLTAIFQEMTNKNYGGNKVRYINHWVRQDQQKTVS